MNSKTNRLSISRFARIARVTPRALRLYHRLGLLRPAYRDPNNGYRYYTPKQVRQVVNIKLSQEFGFNLKEIKRARGKALKTRINQLREEISMAHKRLNFLQGLSDFFNKNIAKDIKSVKTGNWWLLTLLVNHGQYYKIDQYLDRLSQIANKESLRCRNTEILFYLTPHFSPHDSRLKLALCCRQADLDKINFPLPPNIKKEYFPPTKAWRYVYHGPYQFLPLIYQRLDHYSFEKNIKVKLPIFERYIKGPLNAPSEYDYITEIYYPE